MMYMQRRHSTTGKIGKFRDKIPMILDTENETIDEEVRDLDTLRKASGKEYCDKKKQKKEKVIH